MGWRYFLFTLGGITLFIFFLRFVVFRLEESPKFLIYKGKDAEAIEVIQQVAKTNGRTCNLTLADFERLTGEDDPLFKSTTGRRNNKQHRLSWKQKAFSALDRYRMLFDGWQMSRLTVLVWLTYIFDFWGFTVASKCKTAA